MRSSGVQLHITSLPGGTLGRDAYRFADWLAAAGQSWWQVLPLGPPDRHRSPYKSRSAFAAWPGLLPVSARRAPVRSSERLDFCERERFWIFDWERFAGRGAIADQLRFDREWRALRAYCGERGIGLLGDVAIYVAPGSADHLLHPAIFRDGMVAGTPPDMYSATGQLWGNPLYDWPALRRRRYRWWVERLRRTLALFDVARIDHFRGFVAYWEVPARSRTALGGRWVRGPGRAVFDAVSRELGADLPLIAEDLGVITPPVERLRDELGYPGMLVLELGFEPSEPRSVHRFGNHVENRVIYTATHDNDTIYGWWQGLDGARRELVVRELSARGLSPGRQPWWSLIRLAFASPARIAMVQAQDVLGLGSEARMNRPARASGSWRWRLDGPLSAALARRLREVTVEARRLGAATPARSPSNTGTRM